MDQPAAPSPWSRAAEMLAAILAIVGSALLLARGEVYPADWAREVKQLLRDAEAYVRQLLLEEARKLVVRAFKPRGPRREKPEIVRGDRLAFRKLMPAEPGLVRISFPLPDSALPAEEWRVRFCPLAREAAERAPGPPASSRQGLSKPPTPEPYTHEKTGRQDAGGTREPRPGRRSEPKGPKYFGDVRIYDSKCNEARDQAWRDYWMRPADQPVERPEPEDRYVDAVPLARRWEALRRVVAAPVRYARLVARRLRHIAPSTIAARWWRGRAR